MKKLLPLLLITAFFAACKKIPEPIPTVEPPVSSYPFDTARYQTKEPYITLEDRGLEAFLVIDGLDSDNQVNGKISAKDADNITHFNLRSENSDSLRAEKYLFFGNLYALLDLKNHGIYDFKLPKLPVKSISDFKKFINLRSINSSCFENIQIFDFSGTTQLHDITMIHFGNVKIIGRDSINGIRLTSESRFSMDDALNPTKLDLSEVKVVTNINANSFSDIEFPKNAKIISITKSDLDGTKLNDYLAKINIKRIDLDELPRVKSLKLVSNINIVLHVNNCKNLEEINFDNVNNLSELGVSNSPSLKTMDISKYKDILYISSLGNTKMDTIFINKDQSLVPTCNYCKTQKDPWTVWKVK